MGQSTEYSCELPVVLEPYLRSLATVQSTARPKLEVLCHVASSCPLTSFVLMTNPIYTVTKGYYYGTVHPQQEQISENDLTSLAKTQTSTDSSTKLAARSPPAARYASRPSQPLASVTPSRPRRRRRYLIPVYPRLPRPPIFFPDFHTPRQIDMEEDPVCKNVLCGSGLRTFLLES